MQYWGFLEGAWDFKARSTAKEHTNEVESGGRDPGVSRPLCDRPFDMGKRCVGLAVMTIDFFFQYPFSRQWFRTISTSPAWSTKAHPCPQFAGFKTYRELRSTRCIISVWDLKESLYSPQEQRYDGWYLYSPQEHRYDRWIRRVFGFRLHSSILYYAQLRMEEYPACSCFDLERLWSKKRTHTQPRTRTHRFQWHHASWYAAKLVQEEQKPHQERTALSSDW